MIPPFLHQLEGIEFARVDRAAMLAHDMGTGKTRTGIMLADRCACRRILVVCPAIAVGVWRDQIHKWSTVDRLVTIIRRSVDKAPINTPGWTIISYDLLSRNAALADMIATQGWDLVICDEAHALKEPSSKRTKALYGPKCKGDGGIVARADMTLLLTGTPMPNHPGELWPHLRALRPTLLRHLSYDEFTAAYCDAKITWIGNRQFETLRAKTGVALEDLKRRLAPFMHRVCRRDVLPDLPPISWQMVSVALSDCKASPELIADWRRAEADLIRDLGGAESDELLLRAQASPHASTARRLTGIIKTTAAVEAIRAELHDYGHKVVVFFYHRAVGAMLKTALHKYDVCYIDGETPVEDRDDIVAKFQLFSTARVFIGQMRAAGESIDLSVASSIWLIEPAWTPKDNEQPVARCHRHGQLNPVVVKVLSLEQSIDNAINKVWVRKEESIAALIEEDVV